jgi:ABC-2 type transport system permease protein
MIVNGDFDFVLVKPMNSLFRVLLGGADIIDFITIPPLIFVTVYVGALLNPTFINTVYFILLLINALLIATAFHIIVLALAIITLEIDHTVMIYRDLTNLGRLPIDIYKQPLQGFITYFIPVGVMITLPAKAIMGIVGPVGILTALLIGILAIIISTRFWNFALRKYTSASS